MISPSSASELWDKLVVAGKQSPGVCVLSGHARKIGWDIAAAKGQDGATTTRAGEPIGEFDAEFYLADADDFAAWDDFQALLESSVNGADPVALDVVHPDLQRNHFTSVVLGSISETKLDGKGGGTIKVHLIEYRPPKPKPATGASGSKKSSSSGGSKDEADTAIEDAMAELNNLLAEGDSL